MEKTMRLRVLSIRRTIFRGDGPLCAKAGLSAISSSRVAALFDNKHKRILVKQTVGNEPVWELPL